MENKGITIIALVITIIVLLILSGVTIKILTGNNGILNKAMEAKKVTEIDSEKEKIQLAVIQTIQDNESFKIEKEQLEQNLITNIGKNETELRENEKGYLVKILKTQRYYSVSENGEVDFIGNASEIEGNMQNIMLGDNLLNSIDLKKNTYISSTNGKENEYSGWTSSNYIDISNYKKILVVSDNDTFLDKYNALYNENKELLRIIEIRKSKVTNELLGEVNVSISIVNLNENEKYIRISQVSEIMNHIKIYPILDENYNNIIELNINRSMLNEYNFEKNIFENDKIKIIKNTYINAINGEEISYNSWDSTDFIDVENYNKIAIAYESVNPVNDYSAMYDSERKYVSKLSIEKNTIDLKKGKIVVLKIPENVKYIRLSKNSGTLDSIKIFPIIENNESIKNYTNQNIRIGESILSDELMISDYYIDTTGGEASYKGWATTDYLNLENYKRILITNNNNKFNAIYDKDKKFIKTLNFSNCNLYNSKIGYVGAEIAYIEVTDVFKYIRLSNNTNKLKNVKIYPISNDDFNKHLIFNIDN